MEPVSKEPASVPIWFLTMVTIALVICALWFGRGFLMPLAITGLLYILTSALVDKIQHTSLMGWSPPGWMAQLLSTVLIIGAIILLGLVASSSADDVQDALPRYQERFSVLSEQLEGFLGPKIVTSTQQAIEQADVGSWITSAMSGIGGALSTLGLITLYLAFLTGERLAWAAKLPLLASTEEETRRAKKVLARISDGVKQYMWVNAVTSSMSGIIAFCIFSWVGLDFAPLLALTVFIAGFIPNIGAFIAITLPSLVALIQFDTLKPFLIVLLGYGLADQFIANVIQPKMQGRSLNLSTFMVMVALTFWATVWGGMGAFLAIPMTVVIMVVCAEISAMRWIAVLLSTDGQLSQEKTDVGDLKKQSAHSRAG